MQRSGSGSTYPNDHHLGGGEVRVLVLRPLNGGEVSADEFKPPSPAIMCANCPTKAGRWVVFGTAAVDIDQNTRQGCD